MAAAGLEMGAHEEAELGILGAIPGCVSAVCVPGAKVVQDSGLQGFALELSPTAIAAKDVLDYKVGGASLYIIQDRDIEEASVLSRLTALAEVVPHESTEEFTLSHGDKREWRPALTGANAYVKVCRSHDADEHSCTWYLVVRSDVPIGAREMTRVFGSMAYGQIVGSTEWRQLCYASSKNRNRIAALAADALGVRIQTHTDTAQSSSKGGAVNIGVPTIENATNTYVLLDNGNVAFYGGCTCTKMAHRGILVAPSANQEKLVHGCPETGSNRFGGPFTSPLLNAFPVATGKGDPKAMPGARERQSIARRMRWAGNMDLCAAAVRARTAPMDPAWFATAVSSLGWSYDWNSTTLETVAAVLGGDDETSMSLETLLELSDTQEDVVVSTANPAVMNLLKYARKVAYVMKGMPGTRKTFAQFMDGAESGAVRVPRAALMALNTILGARA